MDKPSRLLVSITWGSMLRVIAAALFFIALYLIRDILLIILTSVIIATSIEPATKWLMKYRLPRVIAVIALFAVFFALFAGLFYFFLPPLLDDISGLISTVPDYLESFSLSNSPSLSSFLGPGNVVDDLSGATLSPKEFVSELKTTFFDFSGGIFHGVNIVFGGLMSFIIIIVISFYLAVQDRGIESFLRIVTPLRYEEYVLDLWTRTQHKIGLWMQGQIILGVLIGIFVYLGMAVLNIPYALLLGVLAALFELIPLFGPILAAVPAVALAFMHAGPALGFTVIGFYVIIQQFENHLIYPLVVRKVIGVPPLLVILGLIIFGKLFGFLGLIIAVPAVTMIIEIADDIEKRKGERRRAATT